jgi:hypothetical protein
VVLPYTDYKKDHIRLHLKQQKTLRDSENPLVLPPRINYVDPYTPIKRQKERRATLTQPKNHQPDKTTPMSGKVGF